MRAVLESSTSSSRVPDLDEAADVAQSTESPAKDKGPKAIEALLSRGAHICTVFAQMTTLVELTDENKGKNVLFCPAVVLFVLGGQEFLDRIRETQSLLSNSTSLQELILSSYSDAKSEDASFQALQRSGDKVDRALEKLRKSALKSLESVDVSDYSLQDARAGLARLLEGIIGLFEKVLQVVSCPSPFDTGPNADSGRN